METRSLQSPLTIYALDFDGVLVDSAAAEQTGRSCYAAAKILFEGVSWLDQTPE